MYGEGLTVRSDAVEVDGGRSNLEAEALGQDDLQDVAGPDVLLARLDGRFKLAPLEVGDQLGRLGRHRRPGRQAVTGDTARVGGARRSRTSPIRASASSYASSGSTPVDAGVGDDFELALGMIKDEHGVAEDEVRFGKSERVRIVIGKLSKWRTIS